MDAMESTSRGWWRPSPGSVYPMLQQLADEGLLTKRETDGKYEITPQGKEEVEWPMRMQGGGPQSVDGVLAEMESYVAYLEDLGQARDPRVGKNAGKIKELGNRLTKLGSSS